VYSHEHLVNITDGLTQQECEVSAKIIRELLPNAQVECVLSQWVLDRMKEQP